MDSGSMVVGFILVVLATVVLVFWLIFLLVSRVFSTASGWGRLAAVYGCGTVAGVELTRGESICVGPIRYRRCAQVAVRPEGLYLKIALLRFHSLLRIPWREFGRAEPASFYNRPCMGFTIGAPRRGEIRIPLHVYRMTLPYLTAGSASARDSA